MYIVGWNSIILNTWHNTHTIFLSSLSSTKLISFHKHGENVFLFIMEETHCLMFKSFFKYDPKLCLQQKLFFP